MANGALSPARPDDRQNPVPGAPSRRGGYRGAIIGCAISAFMGAVWIIGGLAALGQAAAVPVAGVVGVACVLFYLAMRATPFRPAIPEPTQTDRTLFRAAMIFEGVGCFLVFAVANIVQRSDIVPPLIAIVIGLHFLPLARALHRPSLNRTAIVAVAGSIVALIGWTGGMREAIAAFSTGAALWISAVEMAWPGLRRTPR